MLRRTCLLLLLLVTSVHAETYLIAAGVESYDDQRIAPLKYAVADAKSIVASFRASGVPRPNVTLLLSTETNSKRRPTRIALLTALEGVREKARAGDKVVFFFAGHGIEEGGQQYLLTADTRRSLLKETALPTSLINKALAGIRAHELLFLIDACRNNPNASRSDEGAQLTEGLIRGIQPEPQRDAEPPVVATLLACDVGQRAYEDPAAGHGVFTVFLLKGLGGAAAGDDGQVRLLSLTLYVKQAIEEWCARTNRTQSPRLVDPDQRDMVLLKPPPEPLVSVSFRGTTLADATTQLAEDYGVQIVLGKGANPEAKVSGHLENQPLSVALKVLLLAHDLTLRKQGAIYVIEEPGAAAVAPDGIDLGEYAGEFPGAVIVVAQDGSGDCRTIGQAVARAKDGARILIRRGVYREQVAPQKRLALVGEAGAERPVVQGVGDAAVQLGQPGSGTLLKHLSLVGATTRSTKTRAVDIVRASNCRIIDCHLTAPQSRGLSASMALGLVVVDTHIERCGDYGVIAISGTEIELRNCCVEAIEYGYAVGLGTGSTAVLTQTTVQANAFVGLYLGTSTRTRLQECRFVDNGQSGVWLADGSPQVAFERCVLTGNGEAGVRVNQRPPEYVYDEATQQWVEAGPNPPAYESHPVQVSHCDLRGNAKGAFLLVGDVVLEGSGNTFDADDKTVPVAFGADEQAVLPTYAATDPKPADWPADLPWPPVPNAGLQYRVRPRDHMPQVLIPAGEFLMGSPEGQGSAVEHPQGKVYVSACWMDLHEVTNQQYAAFVKATGRAGGEEWQGWVRSTSPQHPALYATRSDALAYAAWVGSRLPTEAQWEKAARGGLEGRLYPWGDQPDPQRANVAWTGHEETDSTKAVKPVGQYAPNAFGLFDMSGNVWDYVRDWHDYEYYSRRPARDPYNTTPSGYSLARGGSWKEDGNHA